MRAVRVCTDEDMHPYECDGPGRCVHCDRRKTVQHSPATCALCYPTHDHQPNARRPPGKS